MKQVTKDTAPATDLEKEIQRLARLQGYPTQKLSESQYSKVLKTAHENVFGKPVDYTIEDETEQSAPIDNKDAFTGGDWFESHSKTTKKELSGRWFKSVKNKNTIGGKIVASCWGDTITEAEANAALLSQAKNMYKALQELLKVINRSETALHYYGDAIKKAEAAIQKANPKQ